MRDLPFVGGGGVFSMVEPTLLGWDVQECAYSSPQRPSVGSSCSWLHAVASSQDHRLGRGGPRAASARD